MTETAQKTDIKDMSFEQALGELETLVGKLEQGQGDLDGAVSAYERGVALRSHCEAKLKEAESKIEKISLSPDGSVKTEVLDGA